MARIVVIMATGETDQKLMSNKQTKTTLECYNIKSHVTVLLILSSKQKDLVCVFKHCYLELECLYISIALLPGQVIVVLLRMQP